MHTEVLLALVVVDQPDRRVAELAVALQLADHELARVARADDQHFLPARDEARAWALDHRARDQPRVRDELPDPVPVDPQARTAAASRITDTTRSCASAGSPAHIGSARFSRAARSVSGSEPSFQPR